MPPCTVEDDEEELKERMYKKHFFDDDLRCAGFTLTSHLYICNGLTNTAAG